MLNAVPKIGRNPPVTLDMLMVTWIFSSLDTSLKILTDPNSDYSRMMTFFESQMFILMFSTKINQKNVAKSYLTLLTST